MASAKTHLLGDVDDTLQFGEEEEENTNKLKTLRFIESHESGHINTTRLTARRFPSLYENNKTKRKDPLRKCVVCKKNNKSSQTLYQCENCNVGLCVYPCFENFHTEY